MFDPLFSPEDMATHTVSTICNGVRHEFRFAEDDASAVLGAVLDADYLDWWAMHELYVQIRDIIGPGIAAAMNRVGVETKRPGNLQ